MNLDICIYVFSHCFVIPIIAHLNLSRYLHILKNLFVELYLKIGLYKAVLANKSKSEVLCTVPLPFVL